jgi:type I restriction enzyme M protein
VGQPNSDKPVVEELPFADELWEACDRLRGRVDSAEYKHLALGLVFLKYASDSRVEGSRQDGVDSAREGFIVPAPARWAALSAVAGDADFGSRIDMALEEIESANGSRLKEALPRIYARSPLDPQRLADLFATIGKVHFGEIGPAARDVLGRTYEYFVKRFAVSEGQRGGEFYTPPSVTRLLVEMLEPYVGKVMDPACGSCGLFVQSVDFVTRRGKQPDEISIYGQEANSATLRIGRMNLAIHGLAGDIRLGDSLLDDRHTGLEVDFLLANPPFNQSRWGAGQSPDDPRWKYGSPQDSNANFAWIQHFIHHLGPAGRAGFVMTNGSLTSSQSGDGKIRERIIRAGLVDCIVSCPSQLFYSTQIPVCLWLLDRGKRLRGERRRDEVLFIDARHLGRRTSRTQHELGEDDIAQIAGAYRSWRSADGDYADVEGLCATATLEEVERHDFALTPGRYVRPAPAPEDDGSLEGRLADLADRLREELGESERLTREVESAMAAVGHEL